MTSPQERFRLQMMLACSTDAQTSEAERLSASLQSGSTSEKNEVLRLLVPSLQRRESANWCIAVLHYGCCSSIEWLRKKTQSQTGAPPLCWEELVSAFDAACEEATPEDLARADVLRRLRNKARTLSNGPKRQDQSQAYAEAQLTQAHQSMPLDDLFSGLGGDPLADITEERARSFLQFLVHRPDSRLLDQDIEPILQKLFHRDEGANATQRKRKERAMTRIAAERPVTKTTPSGYRTESRRSPKGKKP